MYQPNPNSLLRSKLLGVAFLLSIVSSGCGKKDQSSAADAHTTPVLPVKVQTVQTSQIRDSSEFVGTLEAQKRVSLQPQIQGRIAQVFVANGERVKQGTPILSLSLDQTQAQVNSAIASANSSEAALRTAQAQLQEAEANQAKAVSGVSLQRVQFKRTQILVKEGAQARQELDIAQNNLDTAISTLRAAEKQVTAGKAGVNQAEFNLQQAQANVTAAKVNLNYKLVLAPINGVVGDITVKTGDYVNTGQTLTTITENASLDMRISVPSNYSTQLNLGLPVELIDTSTRKQLTTGRVNFIAPSVEKSGQSILIKARFSNQEGKLRDGQYVQARIVWRRSTGILIPTSVVKRIGGQSFVFVAQKNTSQGKPQQVVHQRPVKLGDVQGDSYQVVEGIKAGERIAVSNILKLQDGAPIQPQS